MGRDPGRDSARVRKEKESLGFNARIKKPKFSTIKVDFLITMQSFLPMLQVSPPNPEAQEHWKWPGRWGSSSQVPPFLHGLGSHGLAADK